jgi:hypothetical protein
MAKYIAVATARKMADKQVSVLRQAMERRASGSGQNGKSGDKKSSEQSSNKKR